MKIFDIAVIGGGPAGMMAALRAAQFGASTALIEKNDQLGKKLMLTGRGRCNYAHHEEDPAKLAQAFGPKGSFLLPAFQSFGAAQVVQFFRRWGVEPAYERGHRIYPAEGLDASALLNALWAALKESRVTVLRQTEVRGMDILGGKVRRLITRQGEIEAKAFIVATGGLSFPATGSTGDGYLWARKAGLTVVEPTPALCPIRIRERLDEGLAGLKLKNVRLKLIQGGEVKGERFGEMDFTPFGVSGAIAMDLAADVGACLKESDPPELHIDLKPALDPERLDNRIDRDFQEFTGEALRFALRKMLPRQIIPEVVKMAGLDLGTPCQDLSPEDRLALRKAMKDFVVTPIGLLGFRYAIVTAGGVDPQDLDPATMASKAVANLYWAGEVLDLQAPTGGYNLQECWSTGFQAGSAAAASLGFAPPAETDQEPAQEKEQPRESCFLNAPSREEPRENMSDHQQPRRDDSDFAGWKDPRRSSGGDRPSRPRREEGSFSDRPRRPFRYEDEGFRPGRPSRPRSGEGSFGDRPRRPFRSEDEGFRPDRPSRPRSGEGSFGDRPRRPFRSEDEGWGPQGPRREGGPRPLRGDRPGRPRKGRSGDQDQ